MTFTEVMITIKRNNQQWIDRLIGPGKRLPIKGDGGGGWGAVRMLRVPSFSNIVPWVALIHKNLYCWVC